MSRGHDGHLYKVNRAALRRDCQRINARCYLCGQPIDYGASSPAPLSFTADHRIPVNAGGSDRMENLAPCHWKCNRAKSDKLVDGKPKKSPFMATRKWW